MYFSDLPSPRFGYEPNEDNSAVRRFPNRRFKGHARGHGIRGAWAQFAEAHQENKLPRDTTVPGQTYYQTSAYIKY